MTDPSERAHYLDNLRWMAMLLGVFVHASTLGNFGLIDYVTLVSNVFRMALFFIISGYLGAMLLQRQNVLEFWAGRFRNLAIPFAAALLLLNPLTIWLMFQYADGKPSLARVLSVFQGQEQGLQMIVVWHMHLWFLISLMCFVTLAPLLGPLPRLVAQWAERELLLTPLRRRLTPLVVILGSLILSLGLLATLRALSTLIGPEPWLVRVTIQYMPFYILGLVLYHTPTLFARLRQTDYALGAVILSLFIVLQSQYLNLPGANRLSFAALMALRFWMCFFLLDIGYRFFNRSGTLTQLLSASIYTVYLFHFLILYVVALAVGQILAQSSLFYVVVVCLSIGLALALHFMVIARNSWLQLLFNGRKPARMDATQRTLT